MMVVKNTMIMANEIMIVEFVDILVALFLYYESSTRCLSRRYVLTRMKLSHTTLLITIYILH